MPRTLRFYAKAFLAFSHSALYSAIKKKIITRYRRLPYNYPNLHSRDLALLDMDETNVMRFNV